MSSDKALYKIKVKGRLSADWSDWFNQMRVTHARDGETVLSGEVADQAELFGLLLRIRDLGLPVEFVIRIKSPRERKRSQRKRARDAST